MVEQEHADEPERFGSGEQMSYHWSVVPGTCALLYIRGFVRVCMNNRYEHRYIQIFLAASALTAVSLSQVPRRPAAVRSS